MRTDRSFLVNYVPSEAELRASDSNRQRDPVGRRRRRRNRRKKKEERNTSVVLALSPLIDRLIPQQLPFLDHPKLTLEDVQTADPFSLARLIVGRLILVTLRKFHDKTNGPRSSRKLEIEESSSSNHLSV